MTPPLLLPLQMPLTIPPSLVEDSPVVGGDLPSAHWQEKPSTGNPGSKVEIEDAGEVMPGGGDVQVSFLFIFS